MELKIIKEEKDFLQAELVGEGHTFTNLLKEELWEDEKVKSAAYVIPHPLTSNPQIIVRTSGKMPKTALRDAAERIEKKAKEFSEKFKKAGKK